MKTKNQILLCFSLTLLLFCTQNHSYGHQNNPTKELMYVNVKSPSTDRILFFQNQYFVWIRLDTLLKDSVIFTNLGRYFYNRNTIIFTCTGEDTIINKYFFYNKQKGTYEFHDDPETFPPGNIKRVYFDIFKKQKPMFSEIEQVINFKGVNENGKIKITFKYQNKDRTAEYILFDDKNMKRR